MKICNVSNSFTPNNQFTPHNQFTPQYYGDPFDPSFWLKSNITWCSNFLVELVCVFVGYLYMLYKTIRQYKSITSYIITKCPHETPIGPTVHKGSSVQGQMIWLWNYYQVPNKRSGCLLKLPQLLHRYVAYWGRYIY